MAARNVSTAVAVVLPLPDFLIPASPSSSVTSIPCAVVRRMASRLPRGEGRRRRVMGESTKVDFAPLLPWFQPPGVQPTPYSHHNPPSPAPAAHSAPPCRKAPPADHWPDTPPPVP